MATNNNHVSLKKNTEQHVTKTTFPERARDQHIQPRRFLSIEEMNSRKAKGLCYFCDEQYSPEHYKTHKKAQLFILEVGEGIEEVFLDAENGQEEPVGEVAHI